MITIQSRPDAGFTLIELIMVIVLLTIISVAVAVKWPADMKQTAAKKEFIQAVRTAQHFALTRQWAGPASSWGLTVDDNKYYVGRADANCTSNCINSGCADATLCNRSLLGDATVQLSGNQVLFNGLGEPIDNSGELLGNTGFVVAGSLQLTVCAQTGYVNDGEGCP